jgi:hypothetical protein
MCYKRIIWTVPKKKNEYTTYFVKQVEVTNIIFFGVNKFMNGFLPFDFRFRRG